MTARALLMKGDVCLGEFVVHNRRHNALKRRIVREQLAPMRRLDSC